MTTFVFIFFHHFTNIAMNYDLVVARPSLVLLLYASLFDTSHNFTSKQTLFSSTAHMHQAIIACCRPCVYVVVIASYHYTQKTSLQIFLVLLADRVAMVYCDACKETSCSSETQIEGGLEEDIVIFK